jgi:hypothetical protein
MLKQQCKNRVCWLVIKTRKSYRIAKKRRRKENENPTGTFVYAIFLYYILLFFIIFKIVNIEKIYFLKLWLDGLENMRQNWKKKLNKTRVKFKFSKTTQSCILKIIKKLCYPNMPVTFLSCNGRGSSKHLQ